MTAELAATVPAVVLVLAVALSAIDLGIDRLRCQDATRVAARELARGEVEGSAAEHASRMLPDGARVSITAGGAEVTVTATITSPRLVRGLGLPDVTACSSTAVRESGAGR